MSVPPTAGASPPAQPPKPRPSAWRTAWRIFWWGSTLAGAWMLVLMFRSTPVPRIALSHQAEQSAGEKLAQLAAPPSPDGGPDSPHKLMLTEEELNSYLAAHLPRDSAAPPTLDPVRASVRDVKITLQGDTAGVYAVFNLMGKDLTLRLDGRLHVVDGFLRFEPTAGSLGDLSLPRSALDATVARMLDDPQNREAFRMPADIRDVRVENGELVIERK